MPFLPLHLVTALFLCSSFYLSLAIPLEGDNGILYRFSPTSGNETDELLAWAEVSYRRDAQCFPFRFSVHSVQLCGWDLRQISRSHIDIYFPHLALATAELDLLPPTLSQSASHHTIAGRTPPFPHAYRAGSASSATRRQERGDPVALPSNETFHAGYHTLDEINDFVLDLADAYPRQVSVIPLGHSGEGREMFALEITAGASASQVSHDLKSQVVLNKKGNSGNAKSPCGFLITNSQHAREIKSLFFRDMN